MEWNVWSLKYVKLEHRDVIAILLAWNQFSNKVTDEIKKHCKEFGHLMNYKGVLVMPYNDRMKEALEEVREKDWSSALKDRLADDQYPFLLVINKDFNDFSPKTDKFAFVWFSDLKGNEENIWEILGAIAQKVDRKEDIFGYLTGVAEEAKQGKFRKQLARLSNYTEVETPIIPGIISLDAGAIWAAKERAHEPQRIEIGPDATEHNLVLRPQPTVLIVCAKDCESAAVRATFDRYGDETGRLNDPNIYRIGSYDVKGSARKVLLVTSGMGNQNAGSVTTQALNSFRGIEHILLVGIAGGCPNLTVPAEHVRLGDIVVVDHRGIVQYDNVKVTRKTVQFRGHPQIPDAQMLQAAQELDTEAALGKRPWKAWIEVGTQRYQAAKRPADGADVLHLGSKAVAHPKDNRRDKGWPRVHRGAIASADTLLKDPRKRDMLRDKWNVRAIEMEGSGFENAAWMQGKNVMIVRGICDYCDGFKNDDWQPYASLVAASYARAMIETLPEEWFQ